jgi:hypothetical protein
MSATADETRPPIPASLAERPERGGLAVLDYLAARSRKEGDCLVWGLGCDRKGYGRARIAGRMTLVHRAAWMARYGQPPPGKPHVLHHCDNPPCWKDGHLFVGTDKDNAEDREAKGRNGYSKRTRCPQGHPYDEANTYITKDGKRMCRKCLRSRDAVQNAKRQRPSRRPRTLKSECMHGHPFDGPNLYVDPSGQRHCRTCRAAADTRRRSPRKVQANA